MHHLVYLSNALIHVDPPNASGDEYPYVGGRDYGDLTTHRHSHRHYKWRQASVSGDSALPRTGDV